MGTSRIAAWVQARAAAEALKREAFKYAARAAPYDDDATRRTVLAEERRRIEDSVAELAGSEVAAAAAGSTPRGDLAPDDYIEHRVRQQVESFYLPRAETYRKRAAALGRIEFGLALAATVITAIFGTIDKSALPVPFDFLALASVLTTISGAIVAHVEASRYGFLVMTYRATARRLNHELAEAPASFAVPSVPWSGFVSRCEAIIADENGLWLAKWMK
jgi:hypothetical protein